MGRVRLANTEGGCWYVSYDEDAATTSPSPRRVLVRAVEKRLVELTIPNGPLLHRFISVAFAMLLSLKDDK